MSSKLIYLIDDDRVSNFITGKTIELQPFEKTVKIFENGALALTALKAEDAAGPKFDEMIIFLDINMPVMNGWEFLESLDQDLLAELLPMRLVMLTSSIDQEDLLLSQEYPQVNNYVVKPLTPAKLANIFPDLFQGQAQAG